MGLKLDMEVSQVHQEAEMAHLLRQGAVAVETWNPFSESLKSHDCFLCALIGSIVHLLVESCYIITTTVRTSEKLKIVLIIMIHLKYVIFEKDDLFIFLPFGFLFDSVNFNSMIFVN